METINTDQLKIKNALEDFMNGRPVKPGVVRHEILESWQRSKAFGIDPSLSHTTPILTKEQLSQLLAENRLFINCAGDALKVFNQLINNEDMTMLILDRNSYLLQIIGEGHLRWKIHYKNINLTVGTCVSEKYFGTTPGSLALKYDKPFELSGHEYFLKIWHHIRGFSVPIHNDRNEIIGTLEFTVLKSAPLNHSHTYALVVAIARVIENQLKLMEAIDQKDFFSSSLASLNGIFGRRFNRPWN